MTKGILDDLRRWWHVLPHRGAVGIVLLAWFALFHYLGNSTFGYLKTGSLFSWMHFVFTTSPDDELCLYVPLIVLGLLVWKRDELSVLPLRAWWPALGLVGVALLLHVAGFAVQQARVSIVALVLGMYALSGLFWGPAWLKAVQFPALLLLFLVPIGSVSEPLTLPLRLMATQMSVGVSSGVLGIAVFQNGAQILGPGGQALYEVAPACSGIRSLVSMTMLMLIYGFVSFRTNWRRVVLVATALPVAVLGNALRLTIVIVVGEAFGQQAGVAIEQRLGFLTFGLGLICMLAVTRWLREPQVEQAGATPEVKP